MATLQENLGLQVTGITGLSITDDVLTNGRVTNFLIDGVKDVISRILIVKPGEESLFTKTVILDEATTTLTVDSGRVVSVFRENGTANQLIPADPIPTHFKYLSTDTESLHFRSAFNPCYYIEKKILNIVPTPAASGNSASVEYIFYDSDINQSTASDEWDFPAKYQHLVIVYASCRALLCAMGHVVNKIADYQSPKITIKGDPAGVGDNLRDPGDDYIPDPDASSPEELSITSDIDISSISTETWSSIDYDFDGENIDFLTWFKTAGDMIQKQEDIELAGVQLDKINTFVTAYNSALNSRSNVFDKSLQKYTADYQWMSERHQRLFAEYMSFFGSMVTPQQQGEQPKEQQRRGR